MELLHTHLKATVGDIGGLRVDAAIAYGMSHTRRTMPTEAPSGFVDVYEASVEGMRVVDAASSEVVLELRPGTDMFQEAAQTLLKLGILPEQKRRIAAGTPAPAGYGFSMPYARVRALAEARPWFEKAIDEDDLGRLADHDWLRFETAGMFDVFPCSREEFDRVMDARKAYPEKTTKSDFFTWFARSREIFHDTVTDVISPEAASRIEASARRMVESHETDETVIEKIRWCYKVHPMHAAAFDAHVSGYLQTLRASKAEPSAGFVR